ncbi:HNH endonuclease [Lysinibacillus fusiformis]|uniref:HNH endonuclease n=1 Tax=Lysinibacillus fusiformis TaxID=28031 RepID=UPI0035C264EA
MGWNLNIAEATEKYLTENDCWRYTQQFLMHAHHTSTYKYILMKALLESVAEINDSGRLLFFQVTKHVTKIYWNLVVSHSLSQLNTKNNQSRINKVIEDFQRQHHIPKYWNFDQIPDEQQQQLISQVNAIFKKYVYGSFYKSFDGTIFSFNKKEGWLKLMPPYIVFFERYKPILMKVTNYHLAKFLEKHNSKENVEQILTKVELVSHRQSLEVFQKFLILYGDNYCFYCQKSLIKMHVDHFVPWSYVQNDLLWNFVLACPSCNSSKNNKLAHKKYLDLLLDRNNMWTSYEQMNTYSEHKLVHMYDYAIQNGYKHNWFPKST